MSLSNEERELDGLKRLDSQVVSAVYDKYFPEVYRFVRYRLNDEAAAEDITSDVFMRLLEAVRSGRAPQTNLRGWLLSTAAHIVADHHRRAYRRPTEELSENLFDDAYDPTIDIEQQERSRRLKAARQSCWPTKAISAPAVPPRRQTPAPGACRRETIAKRWSSGAGSAPENLPTSAGCCAASTPPIAIC